MRHSLQRWTGGVKVLVPLVILVAVGWHFTGILLRSELSTTPFELHYGWLIIAGLLSVTAQLLWSLFWVQLLHHYQAKVSWRLGIRAYFLSQLGRYLPGKIWVVLFRVHLLRKYAPSRSMLALTAVYETLTMMGAGALLGLLLLPWLEGDLRDKVAGQEWFLGLIVGMPLAIALGLRFFHGRRTREHPSVAEQTEVEHFPPQIHVPARSVDPRQQNHLPLLVLLRGILQALAGWCLLGLSFWCVLRGLQADPMPLNLNTYLRCTGMIALAYVIGFAVLIVPGGLGIREYFVQVLTATEMATQLPPESAAAFGVVSALVLRFVWTLAELLVILGLYGFAGPPRSPVPPGKGYL